MADKEVIEHTGHGIKNYVRFYYMEKTPTLYRNEGIRQLGVTPHVPIPVYLLFDEELIYLKTSIFSDGNAGSIYSQFGGTSDFFINMDWVKIFQRGWYPYEEARERTRKRNAELLSTQPVSINLIKKIIFRCEADRKRANNILGTNDKYEINRNMFHNEYNYVSDYDVSISKEGKNELLFIWYFNNNNINNHLHTLRVLDKNNNELDNRQLSLSNDSLGWRTVIHNNAFKLEYYIDNMILVQKPPKFST